MKRLTVAVLMGGPSMEREVSLRSGAAVVRALETLGANVIAVDVQGFEAEIPAGAEVAFVALHGTFGEDGTVQNLLEQRGIPYTGSDSRSSALAFNKVSAKMKFNSAGVPTPRYIIARKWLPDWQQLETFGVPMVVKPARQGSSVGVHVATDRAQMKAACLDAWTYDEQLVVEEFIKGRELTVGIFDGKALPVVEIRPKTGWFDYHAKYTKGETEYLVPAALDSVTQEKAKYLAMQAFKCLGCRDIARVDLMLAANGKMYVLEVNTIPGFTETSLLPKAAAAARLGFDRLCARLVELALSRRAGAEIAGERT